MWPTTSYSLNPCFIAATRVVAMVELGIKMTKNVSAMFYVLLMIVVVVGVDLLFFRHRTGERLIANIGIVMMFATFYFRFLKHS